MGKVIVDMSMSLDGFVAGPEDGEEHPLGVRGGEHVFDWYQGGPVAIHGQEVTRPEGPVNTAVVEEMYETIGAIIMGRRTYDIVHGWDGSHPLGCPVFILTHEPPKDVPQGKTPITFLSDIGEAVKQAKAAAGDKDVSLGGGSPPQQALAAGLVDEILVHVAPIVLGAGVRLFDRLGADSIRLEPLSTRSGPHVTHLRYRVVK